MNIQETHLSDHRILHLTITNISTSEQIINKSKTIIDYNQIHMSSFDNINSSQNMESSITNIQNLIIPLTKNIPNKIKLKTVDELKFNRDIISSKINPTNAYFSTQFKQLKNKASYESHQAKKAHYSNLLEMNLNDNKNVGLLLMKFSFI